MSGPTLSDAEVTAIKETLNSFSRSLEAQDFAKWVTYWTNDGVLMPPGEPRVVGHEALADFMRKNYGNVKSVALSEWQVVGEGSLAVAATNVHVTPAAENQPPEALKQVVVLSKENADRWRVKTVIFNAGV